MQLSTERKVSVISTYDDAVFYLNEEQDRKLSQLGNNDKINIEGSTIKCSNIRGIYTIEKWQEMHPVEHTGTEKELPKFERTFYDKEQYLNIIKKMITAFRNHFEGRNMPEASQRIIAKMIEKYEKIKEAPEDKKFLSSELNFINLNK